MRINPNVFLRNNLKDHMCSTVSYLEEYPYGNLDGS